MEKLKFSNPVEQINKSITNEVNYRLERFESDPVSALFYCRLEGYVDALVDANAITHEEKSAIKARIFIARHTQFKESREQLTA